MPRTPQPDTEDEPGAAHVAALLGGRCSTLRVVTDGYTPGHKRIVMDALGRQFFVKHASAGSWVAEAYATEAAAHTWLPASATGGLLVGSIVDADGTTLVFHAVEEPEPAADGWTSPDQVLRVLQALKRIYRDLDEAAPTELSSEVPTFWAAQTFWRDCASGKVRPPRQVGGQLLAALAEAEDGALRALGNPVFAREVSHHDVRRDNILISARGVFLIDWNWANRSSRVIDAVCLGIDVAISGVDPELVLTPEGPFAAYDDETVNAVLAATAGYFTSASRVTTDTPHALTSLRKSSAAAGIAWFARRQGLAG